MRTLLTLALAFGLSVVGPASPAPASPSGAEVRGGSGFMLAAIVASHSPLLRAGQKRLVARLAEGKIGGAAGEIRVTADAIRCRASNVDITARGCELTFGSRKVVLRGRGAHELAATLAEAGAVADAAAGTVYIGLSNLTCVISPDELLQRGGGGAVCRFDPVQ